MSIRGKWIFSAATSYTATFNTTPKTVPNYFGNGVPVPFYFKTTINTTGYQSGDIIYLRYYTRDANHATPTEYPKKRYAKLYQNKGFTPDSINMKNLLYLFAFAVVLEVVKKDEPPGNTPKVEFLNIYPAQVKAYADKFFIEISHKDGDGNLGTNNLDTSNLYVTDTRIGLKYKFRLRDLSTPNGTPAIEGKVKIEMPPQLFLQTMAMRLPESVKYEGTGDNSGQGKQHRDNQCDHCNTVAALAAILGKLRHNTMKIFKTLDFGILVFRLGIGLMFIFHGYPKLVGGPEKWESWAMP